MLWNWKQRTVLFICCVSLTTSIILADNLALLSETLRTFNKSACDEEWLNLRCPPATTISIQQVQYGNHFEHVSDISPCISLEYSNLILNSTNTCIWPQAIQAVVGLCQKKSFCKFLTSGNTFGGDPCPGIQKYIQVSYKCQPSEFVSVIGCEDDVLELECNRTHRLAIYSANYGRTEYEAGIQCPQPKHVPEQTCLTNNATEIVMEICHGKRKCALSPDRTIFGSPCKGEDTRMYLKVVHICVPRKVIALKYVKEFELDELQFDDDNYDEDGPFSGRLVELQRQPSMIYSQHQLKTWIPSTKYKSTPNPNLQTPYQMIHLPANTLSHSYDDDAERVYLYVALCVSSGLLVFVLLVLIKVSKQTQVPTGISDDDWTPHEHEQGCHQLQKPKSDSDIEKCNTLTRKPPPPPCCSSSTSMAHLSPSSSGDETGIINKPAERSCKQIVPTSNQQLIFQLRSSSNSNNTKRYNCGVELDDSCCGPTINTRSNTLTKTYNHFSPADKSAEMLKFSNMVQNPNLLLLSPISAQEILEINQLLQQHKQT